MSVNNVCSRCLHQAGRAKRSLGQWPHTSLAPQGWQRRSYSASTRPITDADHQPESTKSAKTKGKVIFSGIQPTGVPHLGNYLGAMRQWKKLQDEATEDTKLMFSIVDLHAITTPQNPEVLRENKRQMVAALLAIGLDPDKSTIFYQSMVPAHCELMWILSCTASMGYLGRMTQWKSKLLDANKGQDLNNAMNTQLKLGLFSYPVLQAADILVHRATHVPVGDDQRQHLEFTRECANNFNAAYGKTFELPETITTHSPRIKNLQSPTDKMSKSHPSPKSRILITDPPSAIRKSISQALTDSVGDSVTYDPQARPGVSNLLEILSQCSRNRPSPSDLAAGTAVASVVPRRPADGHVSLPEREEDLPSLAGAGLGALKKQAAAAVVDELAEVRERYLEVLGRGGGEGSSYVDEVVDRGAREAQMSAAETMRQVRDAVGL